MLIKLMVNYFVLIVVCKNINKNINIENATMLIHTKGRKYLFRKNKKKKNNNFSFKQNIQNNREIQQSNSVKNKFPDKFPFWARLKISKNRTTLVIDEDKVKNKKTNELEDGFVHREATSQFHKGFEEIKPNPDKDKKDPMYLKSPRKIPKTLVKPHNKNLDMPQFLKDRYDKNNRKNT